MELKDFISETIVQIASGVIEATEKCKNMNVIVNPDVTYGQNGEFVVPKNGTFNLERRVQQINMDICVTVTESESKDINAKVGISVLGLGANSSGTTSNTNESRIRFSIPVCLPVSKIMLSAK